MPTSSGSLLAELAADVRQRSMPVSTAKRIADLLRSYLTEGRIEPGSRLSEESLAKALSVSRNTLREAFRLLAHEGLLVHELNRGVFVRRFTRSDVDEIYRLREVLEVSALRDTAAHTPEALAALRACVDEGRTAAEQGDWRAVGTRNLEFHRLIGGLAGNARVDTIMRGLLAEARLAATVMTDVEGFDRPYLEHNTEICEHLEAGRTEEAVRMVADYLGRLRHQFLQAFDTAEALHPVSPAPPSSRVPRT